MTSGTRVSTPAASRARHPSSRSAPKRRAKTSIPRPTNGTFVALLALVVVLNVIGVVMVLSASSVAALRDYGSSWVIFEKQLMWVLAGSAALFVGSRTDYRRWRKFALPLIVVSVALLLLVLVPGVGINVYGSSRWLGAGSFRMQPSELAKLAILLFSADLLAKRSNRMGDTRSTLRPVLAVFGVLAVLIMKQPDMGTTMALACIVLAILFVAGTPLPSLAKVAAFGLTAAVVLARLEPYRWARIVSFRKPFADASNTGYQLAQSLVGLGSGHIFGVGLGASRAKWGYLPHAHTDFIFAVIGDELGLIGTILVVSLFVAFAFLGVRTAVRAPDRFGMLVATGVTASICGQAFINIGAVIGILPVTGVPLPFVSFGGSSLVIAMAATGLLLSVARQGRVASATSSRAG
ncbi:MAG: cell division protein FtsW [Actinomycetota bacterium]|jgi:cell division protein FtsW|nr:cell division protein FtsW [Actinomycetota bacterium]